MKAGFLFQPAGLWIGAHYSRFNRRWCINLLPCCTIWFTLAGGKPSEKAVRRRVDPDLIKARRAYDDADAAAQALWEQSEKLRKEREHNEMINSPEWIARRRECDDWHDRNGYYI